MMRREIKNWFTGAVIWSGEAETVKDALHAAIARGADLRGADLTGADLTGADLTGADLTGADLRGADLTGADLRDADLTDADLTGADLRGADLRDANLTGADLRDADLRGANLRDANLRAFRDDLWAVLSAAPKEAAAVLAALEAGKVDGSVYSGDCACLVGTIANARHCDIHELGDLTPDSSRLAEVWFLQIKPNDTPETHQPTKIAADWTREWIANMRQAFGVSV